MEIVKIIDKSSPRPTFWKSMKKTLPQVTLDILFKRVERNYGLNLCTL